MPPGFPQTDFRAYGVAAISSFVPMTHAENLFDPQERRKQFSWSWQAVRYRYRGCVEFNESFKAPLATPSQSWKNGWNDEESLYKLEHCIYGFFASALSVFDSFSFSLHFFGNALEPMVFPIIDPRRITRRSTAQMFEKIFPSSRVTSLLHELSGSSRLSTIETVRNLVAHRLSGSQRVKFLGTTHVADNETHSPDETWHVPSEPSCVK